MSKFRKAVVAGVGAASAAFFGAMFKGGLPQDAAGWGALLGSAVAVGAAAGWATWRVPNEV